MLTGDGKLGALGTSANGLGFDYGSAFGNPLDLGLTANLFGVSWDDVTSGVRSAGEWLYDVTIGRASERIDTISEGFNEIIVTGQRIIFDAVQNGIDAAKEPLGRTTVKADAKPGQNGFFGSFFGGARGVGTTVDYIYRGTFGPGTITNEYFFQPIDRVVLKPFGQLATAIANSPLGDEGVAMSVTQATNSLPGPLKLSTAVPSAWQVGTKILAPLRTVVKTNPTRSTVRSIDPLAEPVSYVEGGTTYASRLNQTPAKHGRWTGVRGESTFISNNADVRPFVGNGGIRYSDAYPDFFPVSVGNVRISNMTVNRSRNFDAADKAYAELAGVKPKDIRNWRDSNKYTWHEVEDLTTMMLVPRSVNSTFRHSGGIGEINAGAILRRP